MEDERLEYDLKIGDIYNMGKTKELLEEVHINTEDLIIQYNNEIIEYMKKLIEQEQKDIDE